MKVRGLDVVFVHVRKPETLAWYRDVLGLRIGFNDGHWAELGQSNHVRFALDRVSPPTSEVERQAILVSFRVDSVAEAVEELQARGVRFFEGRSGVIQDVGPALVASFQDPEGNWLQLSQAKRDAEEKKLRQNDPSREPGGTAPSRR